MRENLFKQVDTILDAKKDEMISFLIELLKIPSVAGPEKPGMPYGEKVAEALAFATKKADDMGFITGTFENRLNTVDYNNKETNTGFIAHLDVVPADLDKWSYPAFDGTIVGNIIYGRGVVDDKGPAVAGLYAMHAVKEAGIDLKHNVRMLLGGAEETGMDDFSEYVKKNPVPEYFFTPDGEFPIGIGERGLIHLSCNRKAKTDKIMSIKSGSATNIIPEESTAVLRDVSTDAIDKIFSKLALDAKCTAKADGENVIITVSGKGGHASIPNTCINSLTALLDILKIVEPENEFIKELGGSFPHRVFHGEAMGMTGGLINISLTQLKFDGENIFYTVDGRVHETECTEDYVNIIRSVLTGELDIHYVEPHLADKDSHLVRGLQEIYKAETGLEPECYTMAGLTYAHHSGKGVVFGPYIPGDGSGNLHAVDESYNLDTMLSCAKMIAHAIIEFCGVEE